MSCPAPAASGRLGRYGLGVATLALFAVFAGITPDFLTRANLATLASQSSVVAVMAVGSTFAIISRNIDIAPASVGALAAVVVAMVLAGGSGITVALLAGLAATFAVYLAHGAIIGLFGLDPLIVTLAAWIWARGLAVSLTGANTLPIHAPLIRFLGAPVILGFAPSVAVAIAVYAGAWVVLNRTRLGLATYALGQDERALRQAGLSPVRWRVAVFAAMGVTTAVAALLMVARLAAAAPTAGFGLELDAIVSVIIGGTSFKGGYGRLGNTVLGVVFISVLDNGLTGLQIDDAEFQLFKGFAILTALLIEATGRRLGRAGTG